MYINKIKTTDHLTSGCPILAKNEYFRRYDTVCCTFALLNMQIPRHRNDTHTHARARARAHTQTRTRTRTRTHQ